MSKKTKNMKALSIAILPEGIKDYMDIRNSPGFKEFLEQERKKPKKKPLESRLSNGSIIYGGTGISSLHEYYKTLPQVSVEELKNVKGRMVVIYDRLD